MSQIDISCKTVSRRDSRAAVGARSAETTIWLRGEHDISNSTALADELSRAIAGQQGDLVIDLSEVEFMGVATAAVLTRARDFLGSRGRELKLRSPSAPTARLLGFCGLAASIEPSTREESPGRKAGGALATWVGVPVVDAESSRPNDHARPSPEIG